MNVGSNDAMGEWSNTPVVSLQEYKENIQQLILLSKDYSQKVVLLWSIQIDERRTLPMSYWDFWLSNENQKEYNDVLKRSELEHEWCDYIDSRDWIDPQVDLDDGVHPNSNWHEKIFRKMKKILDGLI